jgi:hypothetical protein
MRDLWIFTIDYFVYYIILSYIYLSTVLFVIPDVLGHKDLLFQISHLLLGRILSQYTLFSLLMLAVSYLLLDYHIRQSLEYYVPNTLACYYRLCYYYT